MRLITSLVRWLGNGNIKPFLCVYRRCPRGNRIARQKQNVPHFNSENTLRASTRLIWWTFKLRVTCAKDSRERPQGIVGTHPASRQVCKTWGGTHGSVQTFSSLDSHRMHTEDGPHGTGLQGFFHLACRLEESSVGKRTGSQLRLSVRAYSQKHPFPGGATVWKRGVWRTDGWMDEWMTDGWLERCATCCLVFVVYDTIEKKWALQGSPWLCIICFQ